MAGDQDDRLGQILNDRYRIDAVLGRGGFAVTYRGTELGTERQVAIKEMGLRGIGDWKVLELYQREAKVLAELSHPQIPKLLDSFEVNRDGEPVFYIVRELVEGRSLAEHVECGWRAGPALAGELAAALLDPLIYLHERTPAIIHRDLKPQNVIVGGDGVPHLIDFGAVGAASSATIGGSTMVGTLGYMAPEQLMGRAGASADLYALAQTLVFVITGKPPQDIERYKLRADLRELGLPSRLRRWLDRLGAPDTADRFRSAREARAALPSSRRVKQQLPKLLWAGASLAVTISASALVAAFAMHHHARAQVPMQSREQASVAPPAPPVPPPAYHAQPAPPPDVEHPAVGLPSGSLRDGLVAYWHLDKDRDGRDSAGDHGLAFGEGLVWHAGVAGGAPSQTRDTFWAKTPTKSLIDLQHDFTLSVWCTLQRSWYDNHALFDLGDFKVAVKDGPFWYEPFAYGGRFAVIANQDKQVVKLADTGVVGHVPDGVWHHVVVTRHGPTIALRIDGKAAGEADVGQLQLKTSDTLSIGAYFNGYSWQGRLDEIGVWSRALSAGETVALYRQSAPELFGPIAE